MELQILPVTAPKPPIADESKLVFGKQFTDRMFVMEYDAGRGWHSARIAPYAPFTLDPAALILGDKGPGEREVVILPQEADVIIRG